MNKFFLKSFRVSIFVFAAMLFSINVSAQDVSAEKIQQAIDKLSSYQDVPSAIDCKTTKNKAEKMICGSEYLMLMEKLNTRAAIYAYENATKIELDRNRQNAVEHSRIENIRRLKTEKAIREAFIEYTNDSLGGMSPYHKEN